MTETFQSSGHNIAWPKNYSKYNSAQKTIHPVRC